MWALLFSKKIFKQDFFWCNQGAKSNADFPDRFLVRKEIPNAGARFHSKQKTLLFQFIKRV